MMTWRMLIKLELRRRSLPVVEAVIDLLKPPENVHTSSYNDFRALLALALENYVVMLKDHYDMILAENHRKVMEQHVVEMVDDATRPPK